MISNWTFAKDGNEYLDSFVIFYTYNYRNNYVCKVLQISKKKQYNNKLNFQLFKIWFQPLFYHQHQLFYKVIYIQHYFLSSCIPFTGKGEGGYIKTKWQHPLSVDNDRRSDAKWFLGTKWLLWELADCFILGIG